MGQAVVERFWHFWRELGRRRVLHAAGIYLAGSWLLLQVFDVALIKIGLPQWTMSLSVWLLFIGFPVMMLASWRYEIDRDGIRRTPPAVVDTGTDLSIKPVDYLVIAFIVVFVVFVSVSLTHIMRVDSPEFVTHEAAPASIAVLPFENMSGRQEDEYFGRGLAEDILHRLASIPEMHVASRTASFELDRTNLDMTEIGQRLGVRNVLEGSVRREGDQVRIVAQLIDTQTGYHRWSARYDRHFEDLFQIYDQISTALATELQLTLAPDTELLKPPPTVSMEAYDYFLQARSILQHASQAENVANAQRFFANAIEADPQFADAWAGQCRAFLEWHLFEPATERIEAAERSCRKALELSPDLAEGHVAMGDLYRNIGAYEQSIAEYQQAIKSEPFLAIAWRGIGMAFAELGREVEAENALVNATEYDPDDLLCLFELGDFYMDRGRYVEAKPVFERMALHPRAGASAFNAVGYARSMLGDFEGAAEAWRQAIALEPTGLVYSNVGVMYYYAGNFDAAVIMQQEAVALVPEEPVNWSNLADALRETPDGEADALEAYRKGAELSEKLLAINASDTEMLITLAHCSSRLGDDARAMGLIEQVLQDTPEDPYAHYYAALVHLEAGRLGRALDAITRAVELNFPVVQLRSDPQFEALRPDPLFVELLDNPGKNVNSD